MSQVALSLGRVAQVLGELYGEEVQKEFEAFRSSTGLGENAVVYRDTFHDGSITMRYEYALDNHPIAGILRFWDSGIVADIDKRIRSGETWKTINSVLVVLSFGLDELKTPLSSSQDQALRGALELYASPLDDNQRRDVLNNRADRLVAIADRYLEITRTQLDEGPLGYDVDDVLEVRNRNLPSFNALRGTTLEGSRLRLAKARSYIKEMLATDEGEEACEMEKQCETVYAPAPSCSNWETSYQGGTLYFEGTPVRSWAGGCRAEKKEKDWGGKY